MLRIINSKKNKKKTRTYFDMSSGEKKRILERAVKKASDEQLQLIDQYEKKFGENVDLSKCSS